MEGLLQDTRKDGCGCDTVDAKYVSGLSTILVATIQETKDRISQIEYIFCSQLFPNFQSKYKELQKIYSEAKKAAEETWKEKETNMLCQIEALQLENQKIINENQSLKLDKRKQLLVNEENAEALLVQVRSRQTQIDEVRGELMRKCREVDEGMELQGTLLKMVREKSSDLMSKTKQIKEYEEKMNALIGKVKNLEKKIEELQDELRGKTGKISEEKKRIENLLKKIEFLTLEIANSEQLLNDQEKEKQKLKTKLEYLEEDTSRLQEKLKEKIKTIEDGRKVQEELLLKIETTASEMLENKPQLEEDDKRGNLLLSKVKCLEEKVNELNELIELKNSELLTETQKRLKHIDAYKRLKSQYMFLLAKSDLTTDNMLPQGKLENGSDSLKQQQNLVISPPVIGNKNPDAPVAACGAKKVKKNLIFNDNQVEEKIIKTVQTSGICSPTSRSSEARKNVSDGKFTPVAGTKRPASSWRETRSCQFPGGADPHDDFLNTPFENIRENLKQAMKEDAQDLGDTVPKDTKSDSLDDETQDMNVDQSPEKCPTQVAGASKRTFKYVEPVRKKAERETLKGIECKQCKKFYDAVLPNNASEDCNGNNHNFRCEHHDGVSRHRYKYVPPMTPEGFWNIGFESEM